MKIKVHQLEKQQLQKCLSSTQELLDLYQCQAKLAEQEVFLLLDAKNNNKYL